MKRHGFMLTALFLALLIVLAGQAETTGERVSVILEENPTTGFEWRYIASPEGILKEVSSEYTQDAGTESLMGAGGKHTWTFECAAQGGTVLHFAYARPFEEKLAPARMVSFVYSVDEGLNAMKWGSAEVSGWHVIISLAENPTTGYQWALEPSVDGVLLQESDEYAQIEAREGLVGAGGTHTWRFSAAAAGEITLRFRLERSFEPEAADELRFTFTVDDALNAALKMVE